MFGHPLQFRLHADCLSAVSISHVRQQPSLLGAAEHSFLYFHAYASPHFIRPNKHLPVMTMSQ